MHAVFITPYFYPKVGGLENYALEICRGLLKDHGWKISVITSNDTSEHEVRETIEGITIIRLKTSFHLSNTPVNIFWLKRISELFRELKPDVVNVHLPVPFIGDMGILVAQKCNIPVVLTYHNDIFKEDIIFKTINILYYSLLGNKSLKLADKIIVTSNHYAKISKRLQKLTNKVVIVPPGIHSVALYKQNEKSLKKYVLFVGQLDITHRHKGLDYLIQSLSLLQTHNLDLNLVIAGKGNDLNRYKKLVKDLDLEKRIIFKGFVPDDEMSELYANALVLCLPSISNSEGFGMVILEAATQMTPSIGTLVGGIPSVIINNRTGLLIPARDTQALAESIKRLYLLPEVRNQMGKNAYERVMRDFLWSQQVKKTNDLFLTLI